MSTTKMKHQSYDKYQSQMRVSKHKESKAKVTQQQTCFTKIQKEDGPSNSAKWSPWVGNPEKEILLSKAL